MPHATCLPWLFSMGTVLNNYLCYSELGLANCQLDHIGLHALCLDPDLVAKLETEQTGQHCMAVSLRRDIWRCERLHSCSLPIWGLSLTSGGCQTISPISVAQQGNNYSALRKVGAKVTAYQVPWGQVLAVVKPHALDIQAGVPVRTRRYAFAGWGTGHAAT